MSRRFSEGTHIIVAGRATAHDARVIHLHGDHEIRRGFVTEFAGRGRSNMKRWLASRDLPVMAGRANNRRLRVINHPNVGEQRR
jgi:hypothetical protein